MIRKKPLTRTQIAILLYTGIMSKRLDKRFLNRSLYEQLLEILDYKIADISDDVRVLKKRKLITKNGTYISITSKGREVAIIARDKIAEKYGGFNWSILKQYVYDDNKEPSKPTEEKVSLHYESFKSKLSKSGNSYVIRIPSKIVKDSNIDVGSIISLTLPCGDTNVTIDNLSVVKDGNSIAVRIPALVVDNLSKLTHKFHCNFSISE